MELFQVPIVPSLVPCLAILLMTVLSEFPFKIQGVCTTGTSRVCPFPLAQGKFKCHPEPEPNTAVQMVEFSFIFA
jgi:hypothetical protein